MPFGTIKGAVFDSKDVKKYELKGNIYEQILLFKVDAENNKIETDVEADIIWTIAPMIPKANQQYYLTELGLMLNYMNPEL